MSACVEICRDAESPFHGFPIRREAKRRTADEREASILSALERAGGEATAETLAELTGEECNNLFRIYLASMTHWRLLRRNRTLFSFGPLACRFSVA